MPPMDRREFLCSTGAALAALAASPDAARGAAAGSSDALADLDATALAALVRRRKLGASELAEAAIARIERLDPQLNSVVTRLFERGLERARGPLPDGPFAGVPYLLKNLHAYEGARVSFGSVFFRDNVARYTQEVISRMERAGLVVLGITNAPELGLLPITEPRVHGPTRNPWSPSHSPGGSSGGAAAAVAAGLVPMAQASDGGGSIRIPASACGVFGLKPSRGRNPQWPDVDLHGLSERLCVSRSVRDSAALLDAVQGPVAGDRWWAPPPRRPYRAELESERKGLRIAFTSVDFFGREAHPDCAAAVASSAELCAELGHRVEEARPRIEGEAFDDAFLLLWSTYAGEVIRGVTRKLGHPPAREGFEPWTWQLFELAERHVPADVSLVWKVLQAASYEMARFLAAYDLFLTPVLAAPPVETGALSQDAPFPELREQMARYVPFTPVANVMGLPAMSVPLYWNEAGLPIGSHFLGRFGDEATLFALAGQLERARPWAQRRPPLWAGPV